MSDSESTFEPQTVTIGSDDSRVISLPRQPLRRGASIEESKSKDERKKAKAEKERTKDDLRAQREAEREEKRRLAQEAAERRRKWADPMPHEQIVHLIETELDCQFRMNEITRKIEINGRVMEDEDEARVLGQAKLLHPHGRDMSNVSAVRLALLDIAGQRKYDPLKLYLSECGLRYQSLPEGSPMPFDVLLKCIEPEEGWTSALTLFLRKWLRGCVARIFDTFQNPALLLIGPQGTFKSTFAKWLCGGVGHLYFREGFPRFSDKDSTFDLGRRWIWSIDEVGKLFKTSLSEEIKQFMTQEIVSVRLPYARYESILPRRANMILSDNKSEVLTDLTGNRRFLPIRVRAIDFPSLERVVDREALWGQMVYELAIGESPLLTDTERAYQSEMNELVTVEEPLMALLQEWLEPCPENFIPSRQIFEKVKTMGGRPLEYDSLKDKNLETKISSCMQKLGYQRAQPRLPGERPRGFRGAAWRKGHYP